MIASLRRKQRPDYRFNSLAERLWYTGSLIAKALYAIADEQPNSYITDLVADVLEIISGLHGWKYGYLKNEILGILIDVAEQNELMDIDRLDALRVYCEDEMDSMPDSDDNEAFSPYVMVIETRNRIAKALETEGVPVLLPLSNLYGISVFSLDDTDEIGSTKTMPYSISAKGFQ